MKSLKSALPLFFRASQQTMMNSSPPLLSPHIITVVCPSEALPSTLMTPPWKAKMHLVTTHPIPHIAKGPLSLLMAPLVALWMAVRACVGGPRWISTR